MSAREWRPGDLAMVTHQATHPQVELCLRGITNNGWMDDGGFIPDEVVLTARPLVVIDPEDPEQVGALAEAYDRILQHTFPDEYETWEDISDSDDEALMRAALRSLIEPPKPPEPQGLGAVVVDAMQNDRLYVRSRTETTKRHWFPADNRGDSRTWDELTAVRVLSEGVCPGEKFPEQAQRDIANRLDRIEKNSPKTGAA